MARKNKLNSNVFWLSVATFLGDISSGLVMVVLPTYLQNVLGLNKTFIGTVEGIADFTAGILRIFSGWFSDKLGKRKVFVFIGYLMAGISRPLLGFTTSGFSVLGLRFADRFGGGIRLAPGDALIADESHAKNRGRAFGFNRALDSLGYVVGPLLAYAILKWVPQGYRMVFWLTSIPTILTIIVVTIFVREKSQRNLTQLPKLSFSGLDKRFKYFVFITVLFTLGNSSDAFLILRAEGLGISPAVIPIWWATYNIVATLLSVPAGMLSDHFGRTKILITGYLCFAAVYFGFAVAGGSAILWIIIVVYGFYKSLVDGTQRALAADLIPAERRGSAFGLYYTILSLATLPSSLIAGFLWDKYGAPMPFYFGAVLAALAVVLLAFFKINTLKNPPV